MPPIAEANLRVALPASMAVSIPFRLSAELRLAAGIVSLAYAIASAGALEAPLALLLAGYIGLGLRTALAVHGGRGRSVLLAACWIDLAFLASALILGADLPAFLPLLFIAPVSVACLELGLRNGIAVTAAAATVLAGMLIASLTGLYVAVAPTATLPGFAAPVVALLREMRPGRVYVHGACRPDAATFSRCFDAVNLLPTEDDALCAARPARLLQVDALIALPIELSECDGTAAPKLRGRVVIAARGLSLGTEEARFLLRLLVRAGDVAAARIADLGRRNSPHPSPPDFRRSS